MPSTLTLHKNVETVRRGYQAFNSADLKTLTELFHKDASWHVPGRSPMAGNYQGRDAVLAFFGRIGQETGGTFRAEAQHLLADEEGRVVAIQHSSGRRGGKQLSADSCLVFQFKDGRVISGQEHYFDHYAVDAFWS